MKTAIQELIEWMTEERFPLSEWVAVMDIKSKATELLEKERQQIMDAVTFGNRQEQYDGTETIGENYYSTTYQNNQ